jgi:hypothetical protein
MTTLIPPVRPPKKLADVAELTRIASAFADAANNKAFSIKTRRQYQQFAEAYFLLAMQAREE